MSDEDIREEDPYKSRPWTRPTRLGVADALGLAYLVLLAAVLIVAYVF